MFFISLFHISSPAIFRCLQLRCRILKSFRVFFQKNISNLSSGAVSAPPSPAGKPSQISSQSYRQMAPGGGVGSGSMAKLSNSTTISDILGAKIMKVHSRLLGYFSGKPGVFMRPRGAVKLVEHSGPAGRDDSSQPPAWTLSDPAWGQRSEGGHMGMKAALVPKPSSRTTEEFSQTLTEASCDRTNRSHEDAIKSSHLFMFITHDLRFRHHSQIKTINKSL